MEGQRLKAYLLRFQLRAIEPIELDEHPGSSLRGAFFRALWGRFCSRRDEPACAMCPLVQACPVSALVAPLRDETARGRDIPRPFVLEPPEFALRSTPSQQTPMPEAQADEKPGAAATSGQDTHRPGVQIAPKDTLTFGMTIFGSMIKLFPYVVQSAILMEKDGVGRPLHANSGRRGRFQVEGIDLLDPLGAEQEARVHSLYQRGQARVKAPTLAVTAEQVAARAATLPSDRLTLRFLTPTRLIADGQLVRRPDLRIILLRLAERLDALEAEYGEPTTATTATTPSAADDTVALTDGSALEAPTEPKVEAWRLRRQLILEATEAARLTRDETQWVDVLSYSGRQRRATPIGGFVGTATYAGALPQALRELLVWGEIVHVGKNAVKGDGYFHIIGTSEESGDDPPKRHSQEAASGKKQADAQMSEEQHWQDGTSWWAAGI